MKETRTRWLPFSVITPSIGEIIVVKTKKQRIYPYLIKVEGRQKYCRLSDACTKVVLSGESCWMLIDSVDEVEGGEKGVEEKLDRIIELLEILAGDRRS